MSKAHAFAGRSTKTSKTAKSKKTMLQRVAARLGQWIVDREDRLREVKLNREAMKFNHAIDWAAEVAQRAERMRNK